MSALSRTFRALSLDAVVEVDPRLPRAIHDAVDALTASYPRALHPHRRYELRLDPLVVLRDGEPGPVAEHPDDLLMQLELELLHDVGEAAPAGWFLHAAAAARGGRAVVLVGPSGAGKSTAVCGLVARGAAYVTDEMVVIGRSSLFGLRRPIGLDGPPVEPLPGDFVQHLRPDGHARLIVPPARALAERAATVSAIVELHYQPTAPTCLRPRPAAEALGPLWQETRRRDDATLAFALELLSEVPTFHLRSRNLEEACAAVESLFSSTSGTAP